ncbi:hypothetical protein EZV62_020886 [Acer yangbiense]|uniref:Uncharacterized protein n=1 Tax=Acer yangbiense TaxID=1000413 RepID=A0A5C7HF22_9ROSI|nr:hypothetical protein EZV62_020886 [Acer yangbiense]
MVKCSSLEKVNIHMSPADDDMMPEFETDKLSMQQYVCGMILIGKGLYHVKSFTFVHLSKGKFVLYDNTADAETKVVELHKETREEQLLFALPMVQDFDLNQLRHITHVNRNSRKASNSIIGDWKHMVDWFGSEFLMGGFVLKTRLPALLQKYILRKQFKDFCLTEA